MQPVKITRVAVAPYNLKLRPPVLTARGPIVQRSGLRLGVQLDGTLWGLGDASPWPGFAGAADVDLAQLQAEWLAWGQRHLVGQTWLLPQNPQDAVAACDGALARLPDMPSAAAPSLGGALQTALMDALAQLWRRPLAALLSHEVASQVAVHALVDSAWAAKNACAAGFTALKIKVGQMALGDELGKLCAIRSAVGGKVALRLDANGAWPTDVARRALRLFSSVEPAWVEQPVAAGDLDGLRTLRQLGIVPIAADESLLGSASLSRIIEAEAADGVVLKPGFVGGPKEAYAMGQQARAAGLKICVTHALEGGVGRRMALQVALALGAEGPHGLAGALQNDVLDALPVNGGIMTVPHTVGLGLTSKQRRQLEATWLP